MGRERRHEGSAPLSQIPGFAPATSGESQISWRGEGGVGLTREFYAFVNYDVGKITNV